MKGKIVLVPFPFTDLTTTKLRPALVLFEGEQDVVVAFISSRVPEKPSLTDIVVDENHPEFGPIIRECEHQKLVVLHPAYGATLQL